MLLCHRIKTSNLKSRNIFLFNQIMNLIEFGHSTFSLKIHYTYRLGEKIKPQNSYLKLADQVK